MGHFPPTFQSPLAPKLLVGHKKSRWAQNDTDMLYQRAKFGGDLPPHGGERGKIGVFCLFAFFVCYAYSLCTSAWAIGALTVRAMLLPFIGRF